MKNLEIENIIKAKITNSEIEIDMKTENFYNIKVISNAFINMSQSEIQKLMYETIIDYIISKKIIAFSFKTYISMDQKKIK